MVQGGDFDLAAGQRTGALATEGRRERMPRGRETVVVQADVISPPGK